MSLSELINSLRSKADSILISRIDRMYCFSENGWAQLWIAVKCDSQIASIKTRGDAPVHSIRPSLSISGKSRRDWAFNGRRLFHKGNELNCVLRTALVMERDCAPPSNSPTKAITKSGTESQRPDQSQGLRE
jgi:hypothetical protein